MGFQEDMRANNKRYIQDIKTGHEQAKKNIAQPKSSTESKSKKREVSKQWRAVPKWQVITLLVLFFPVGLYLLWRQDRWAKSTKKKATWLTLSVVAACMALIVIFAPPTVGVTSSLAPIKSSSYLMSGTVSPPGSQVTVNDVSAKVTGATFSATVPLHEGDNSMMVVVVSGSKKTQQVVKIHRYTKSEILAQEKAAAKKKADAATAAAKASADAKAKQAQQAAAQQKADADAAAAAAQKKAADAAAAQQKANAAAAAAAAKLPKVLLDITGSGIKQTQSFTTKSSWTIDYTFDCSNFGSQGNFQIYLNNTDGSYNYGAGPNDLAMSGGDTEYYYNDAGGHYLTINSECNWHVTVKS